MRKFTYGMIALLALVLTSGLSSAQHRGGPFGGGGFGRPHGPFDPDDSTHQGPPDSTHFGPPDTTHFGPPDTTHFIGRGHRPGPGLGRGHGPVTLPTNPVGLSDSCYNVFLSMLPSDTAAMLTGDLAQLKANRTLVDTLLSQARAAMQAGDTVALAAIRAQMMTIGKQSQADWKQVGQILHQYRDLVNQTRMNCDAPAHRKSAGGGTPNPPSMTPIIPNPAPANTKAAFSYTVTDTTGSGVQVSIVMYDALGNIVRNIASGNEPAGTYPVSIDLTGLRPGIYIVQAQIGSHVESQKLAIQ